MATGFRGLGWVLILAGVVMLLIGGLSDITVQTAADYSLYGGYTPASRTVNFHKMFSALAWLLGGGFSLIAGAVFAVGAEVMPKDAPAPAAVDTPLPASAAPTPTPAASSPVSEEPINIGGVWGAFAIAGVLVFLVVAAVFAMRNGPSGSEPTGPDPVQATDAAAGLTDAAPAPPSAPAEESRGARPTPTPRSLDETIAPPPGRRTATATEIEAINRRLAEFE